MKKAKACEFEKRGSTRVALLEFSPSARLVARIARVLEAASHVAAGRAFDVEALAAGPLPSGAEGAPQQVRAADGAKAWRCTVAEVGGDEPGACAGGCCPASPAGPVELACVRAADDLTIDE